MSASPCARRCALRCKCGSSAFPEFAHQPKNITEYDVAARRHLHAAALQVREEHLDAFTRQQDMIAGKLGAVWVSRRDWRVRSIV